MYPDPIKAKNKTLGAIFNNRKLLHILETNYNTIRALQGDLEDGMSKHKSFKDFVLSTLSLSELSSKRAVQIDIDVFFKLLLCFNRVGIHFNNVNTSLKIDKGATKDDMSDFNVSDDESNTNT